MFLHMNIRTFVTILSRKAQCNFPKMRGGGQKPFGTFPKIHPFWWFPYSLMVLARAMVLARVMLLDCVMLLPRVMMFARVVMLANVIKLARVMV